MWLEKEELRKLKNKIGLGQLHWLNGEVDDIEKTRAVPGKRVCPKKDGGHLVSVVFGKSSVVLDWCPKCHGIWLDRDEFNKVIEYLTTELGNASVKDVEKEIAEDFKKLVHGGPEGRVAEISDIAAAVTALVNFSIFEHPTLFKAMMNAQAGGRSIGID
jgi:Zn-finger nucleic acid-binding protein